MSETKSNAKVASWLKSIENGDLRKKQTKVLDYIIKNPRTTLHSIRNNTLISHQTITSAISNFMDEGAIKIVNTIEIEGDNYSQFEFVNGEEEREQLKDQRYLDKLVGWAKQGLANYAYKLDAQTKSNLESIIKNNENKVVEGDLNTLFNS